MTSSDREIMISPDLFNHKSPCIILLTATMLIFTQIIITPRKGYLKIPLLKYFEKCMLLLIYEQSHTHHKSGTPIRILEGMFTHVFTHIPLYMCCVVYCSPLRKSTKHPSTHGIIMTCR